MESNWRPRHESIAISTGTWFVIKKKHTENEIAFTINGDAETGCLHIKECRYFHICQFAHTKLQNDGTLKHETIHTEPDKWGRKGNQE